MKTLIFIIFFLFLGAFFILSEEEIKLNSKENFIIFLDSYKIWASELLNNGKTVSGYIIKMEWLPE